MRVITGESHACRSKGKLKLNSSYRTSVHSLGRLALRRLVNLGLYTAGLITEMSCMCAEGLAEGQVTH